MTPQEMWNAYKRINPLIGDEIDAWAFGVEPDLLADLVFKGEKTATASAFDLYALEEEPLLQEGTFDVILDSQNQAVCIVEVTKVSVQPFHQVSADHAYKEGEGDKSLAYWRQVHEDFFTDCLGEAGLTFTPDSKVVLEEFRKVYPLQIAIRKEVLEIIIQSFFLTLNDKTSKQKADNHVRFFESSK